MEVKEAIEFLKFVEDIEYSEENGYVVANGIPCVIELLQRGEKYQKMWNRLYAKYGEVFLNDYRNPEILLEERMENLEQKYFPKTKCPDNFTEKVMEKINNEGER